MMHTQKEHAKPTSYKAPQLGHSWTQLEHSYDPPPLSVRGKQM